MTRARDPIGAKLSLWCLIFSVLPVAAPVSAQVFDPTFELGADSAVVGPGESISVPISMTNPETIVGISLGLIHDEQFVTLVDVVSGVATDALNGGAGPDFFGPNLYGPGEDPDGVGATLGVVTSFVTPDGYDPGVGVEIALFQYEVSVGAPTGANATSLDFTNELGVVGIELIRVAGDWVEPTLVPGAIFVSSGAGLFQRADCNGDGGFDISDQIYLLNTLFIVGTPQPPCFDACDQNDDGLRDIGDAIFGLSALFAGGASPPAPFGVCGEDTTADALDCLSYPACL